MAVVRVRITGPLFDGRAQSAVQEWLRATKQDLAVQAAAVIRAKADKMNRSGRGGTGRAAGGVKVIPGMDPVVQGGLSPGEYAWPWLEGSSRRNQSTPFRGYHTFALARGIVQKRAGALAEAKLKEYIGEMGG